MEEFVKLILLLLLLLLLYTLTQRAMCCTEGSIQLDDATDDSVPLVMLCAQGQWGYVCARETQHSPWSIDHIGVACQQLGYLREGEFD